jgi:hypothetical protein
LDRDGDNMRAVEPLQFDGIYRAFWNIMIEKDGKAAVRRSAERFFSGTERDRLRARRGIPS